VKLLFDENLSARLVELLAPEFPGSVHVEQVLGDFARRPWPQAAC